MAFSDEDRWWKGTAEERRTRPKWIKPGDRRGTENIRKDDLPPFPRARGIDPEAKLVRRELERQFRERSDGPVVISATLFNRVRLSIERLAFPNRHQINERERIEAIRLLAHEYGLGDLSDEDIAHRLALAGTPHDLARWLFARFHDVSPKRLRTPRKS